jgi:D-alanine-D-alanine ligase
VKHPRGYGSTGVWRESRLDAGPQLRPQVDRVCAAFGAARIEEFIVGREFNVLLVESADGSGWPVTYPPAELIFPPGEDFWHTAIKWGDDVPFAFEQVGHAPLAERLRRTARDLFVAMQGVGYARCDIRMNDAGELVVLEINSNPGIMFRPEEYGPADHMILWDEAGYRGFFDRVFRAAIARNARMAR